MKMHSLTHGSLFSGIGGFELGAQMAGIDTVWNCEIIPYNRKILKQHFPHTKQYNDIRELRNPEPVSIISGGFPCQDLSIAGKGKGITGERSGLWSEMFRIIDETRPLYVVIENSPELLKKGFEKVLYPLSEIGYDAEWQCLSGPAFGCEDIRKRLFVIAYTGKNGLQRMVFRPIESHKIHRQGQDYAARVLLPGQWDDGFRDSAIIRRGDVVPHRVDRIAACGNAVKPIIAHYLFNCIKAHYENA